MGFQGFKQSGNIGRIKNLVYIHLKVFRGKNTIGKKFSDEIWILAIEKKYYIKYLYMGLAKKFICFFSVQWL